MSCPVRQGAWVLSVGGLNVRIVADKAAVYVVQALQKLFVGFNVPGSPKIDAELIVTYDSVVGYPQRFDADPVDLTNIDHPLKAKLLQKAKPSHPFYDSKGTHMLLGFLNGVLHYQRGVGRAVCLLFREEAGRSHFLVGSLHKLLFVFLCFLMAENNRFFVHGAAIRRGQNGYIFWGPSGAGKTTIAGFSERNDIFSDDAPILLKENEGFYCAFSPFYQVEMLDNQPINIHGKIPVCKNLFLHKSRELKVTNKGVADALSEIVSSHLHNFKFMDRELKKKAFHFSYDLCHRIPAYDLYFAKDSHFWKLVADKGGNSVKEG
jgi:hypothetical protein